MVSSWWLPVLLVAGFLVACSGAESISQLEALAEEQDGDLCLVCVLGLALFENDAERHAEEIADFLAGLCTRLPTEPEQQACEILLEAFGAEVIVDLLEAYNPNYLCGDSVFGFCSTCTLPFVDPYPEESSARAMAQVVSALMKEHLVERPTRRRASTASGEVPASVLPAHDEDQDYFSPVDNLPRTALWRGKDCNDFTTEMHAGFIDDPDGLVDNNCNGVVGNNPSTGNSYEYDWCEVSEQEETSRYSIVTFGDSAAAAFSIPVEWMYLEDLNTIPAVALQEFDHPDLSWSTGFDVKAGNDSIYMKQRNRNLCNHRDFQNLGVNGAQMDDFPGYQVASMRPSQYRSLAFVAYIGNDVCKKNLEDMTLPSEFREQLIAGLQQLNDASLPGTKVLTVGLVDGRVLWDVMANRIHPLGCYYSDFYEFLTCTGANPCNTWLTPNAATRNATSKRAAELTLEMQAVVGNATANGDYPNLDLQFSEFAIEPIVTAMEILGLDPADLIEPVDGFHPSIFAHRIISNLMEEFIEVTQPTWLGDNNKYNEAIRNAFGDQGGY